MNIINIEHFCDIDELIVNEKLYYELFNEEFVANPDLGNDRIIISGPMYRLCGTGLIIAEGTYCNYNEDTGELEPDFGVSLLYDSYGEPDLDAPLYYEQGTPACMFHNYAVSRTHDSKQFALLEASVA